MVANRLPLDDNAAPDGACEWRRSPGGLASALHAILQQTPATWVGWAGGIGAAPRPAGHRQPADPAGRAVRGRAARLLRGLRELDTVAALPRRRGAAGLRPRLVGDVPGGEPALRRGGRRGGRAGRGDLGAGLPPATGAGDAARAAARPADRLLPARAVPAARAVHAAPPPGRAAARHARRRPGRLPAAAGGAQRRPAGHEAARRAGHRRPDHARRPGGADRRVPGVHRRRRDAGAGRPAGRGAATPGSCAPTWASRGGCCSASTGWTTPRASSTG